MSKENFGSYLMHTTWIFCYSKNGWRGLGIKICKDALKVGIYANLKCLKNQIYVKLRMAGAGSVWVAWVRNNVIMESISIE